MHERQTIVTDNCGICLFVPHSVCHVAPLKNGGTDQNRVWDEHSWGLKEHCVRW